MAIIMIDAAAYLERARALQLYLVLVKGAIVRKVLVIKYILAQQADVLSAYIRTLYHIGLVICQRLVAVSEIVAGIELGIKVNYKLVYINISLDIE